ncbi:MAG: L-malate glycosyltransferase [Thermoleophilaceae bacterium]|nr:L-malate glycosyltransferase [Thermoleophilaceae bacterium]
MRILLVNHTGAWSGAEVSLMRLVAGLAEHHELAIACPGEGRLAEEVDGAGVERLSIPAVDASLRLHPIQTPAGMRQLRAGGAALARAAREFRADIVHANTPRVGIMAGMGLRGSGRPFVVRAHEHLPLSTVGRAVRSLIVRTASGVAAVSDFTARRFNEGLPHPVATRVYNSIDQERFDPERVEPAPIRQELGLGARERLIGQVAQITPWKAQDVSIRALAELRARGVDAHLLLVGQVAFGGKHVRFDNHAFLNSLERLVDELSVRHAVHFLGQRDDVPELMRALDLSLLPSWEEPFGLVTVESMALGTPPLVSADGAGPELVDDGVTGVVVAAKRPDLWARAAEELLRDPDRLQLMGERSRGAAARFRDDVHAAEMLAIFERALARTARGQQHGGRVTATGPADNRVEAPWLS